MAGVRIVAAPSAAETAEAMMQAFTHLSNRLLTRLGLLRKPPDLERHKKTARELRQAVEYRRKTGNFIEDMASGNSGQGQQR